MRRIWRYVSPLTHLNDIIELCLRLVYSTSFHLLPRPSRLAAVYDQGIAVLEESPHLAEDHLPARPSQAAQQTLAADTMSWRGGNKGPYGNGGGGGKGPRAPRFQGHNGGGQYWQGPPPPRAGTFTSMAQEMNSFIENIGALGEMSRPGAILSNQQQGPTS
eukprot:3669256-Pyramimonas_sp.AAC.1